MLPAMPAVKEHFQAMRLTEVGAAIEDVEGSWGSLAAKLCLCFLVPTAAGPQEGARGGVS